MEKLRSALFRNIIEISNRMKELETKRARLTNLLDQADEKQIVKIKNYMDEIDEQINMLRYNLNKEK